MPAPLLSTLLAQDTARATLERALTRERVHHAYLFDGPEGVGKERAALGLAQALVCERRPPGGAQACGQCSACARVPLRAPDEPPTHPDVVLLACGLYKPEQIGRRTDEAHEISIDQVRTLVLARVAFPPHEGKARVFVVRGAEDLSTGASNALLKTLEEPGDRMHFVLLSSQAESLLPTIRSRTQRVRFGPLPDAVVERLLVQGGATPASARAVATLAHGSMAEAARLADPEATAQRDAFVDKAITALHGRGLGPLLEVAEEAKKQKDVLPLYLVALAQRLADQARDEAKAGAGALTPANRYRVALAALTQLRGNAAPQLVVESMLMRMRGA